MGKSRSKDDDEDDDEEDEDEEESARLLFPLKTPASSHEAMGNPATLSFPAALSFISNSTLRRDQEYITKEKGTKTFSATHGNVLNG